MKITAVTLTPVRYPRRTRCAMAGASSTLGGNIVQVFTDEGLVGQDCAGRSRRASGLEEILRRSWSVRIH
jgi:hypothetical protein